MQSSTVCSETEMYLNKSVRWNKSVIHVRKKCRFVFPGRKPRLIIPTPAKNVAFLKWYVDTGYAVCRQYKGEGGVHHEY